LFSSRRRHTRSTRDWSSDVCSSDLAAFGLDKGESLGALLAQGPPAPAIAHLNIDKQGYAWLPEDDFVNHFAGDADPVQAKVMFRSEERRVGKEWRCMWARWDVWHDQ